MEEQTLAESIEGWSELDATQRDRLADIAAAVRGLYPDDEPMQRTALTAVVRHWRGALPLAEVAEQLARARRAEAEALAVARQLGVLAVADGGSVLGTANKLGIDRQALLKWLGRK